MTTESSNWTFVYQDPKTDDITPYSINPELVIETSLLRILHDSLSTVDNVTHTDDPNIEYVAWYLQERPFIHDPEYVEVLEYWGVYRISIYIRMSYKKVNI